MIHNLAMPRKVATVRIRSRLDYFSSTHDDDDVDHLFISNPYAVQDLRLFYKRIDSFQVRIIVPKSLCLIDPD